MDICTLAYLVGFFRCGEPLRVVCVAVLTAPSGMVRKQSISCLLEMVQAHLPELLSDVHARMITKIHILDGGRGAEILAGKRRCLHNHKKSCLRYNCPFGWIRTVFAWGVQAAISNEKSILMCVSGKSVLSARGQCTHLSNN